MWAVQGRSRLQPAGLAARRQGMGRLGAGGVGPVFLLLRIKTKSVRALELHVQPLPSPLHH